MSTCWRRKGKCISEETGKEEIPLIDVEGTAYECGLAYAQIVRERYPGYRRYLDQIYEWERLEGQVRNLFEKHAPFILDIYRGMMEGDRKDSSRTNLEKPHFDDGGCTSFSVSGLWTACGEPLSGQNKDTLCESESLYIVLRMKIKGGPVVLVLCYPGELLGYGLWSTGMSLMRNNLYSRMEVLEGLSMVQWGLLALGSGSVTQATEWAKVYGIAGSGNCVVCDASGQSASVEFSGAGVNVIEAEDGVVVHANHPVGEDTGGLMHIPDKIIEDDSLYRHQRLGDLLASGRGRLTAEVIFEMLADHSRYPLGLCRHPNEAIPDYATTASILANPAAGTLWVVRGQPCRGSAQCYRING